MKIRFYFSILLIISTFTFQSCISFQKELINENPITIKNLSELNGQYEILDLEADSVSKKYWMNNNFFKEIDRKLIKDTLKINESKTYLFELNILNQNNLKIKYIEDGKIIRERILKTKLKKDGYLYLKNKNTGFLFIPYIAGGIDIKKTRFTISKNGDLIFDVVNHRSGAVLLVIFLDGKTWKYRKTYKRTK